MSKWKFETLADCCENLDKLRKPITKSKRTPGTVPYYGASGVVDFVDGYIFDEDLLLVSEDGANLLARTYPIAFSVSGKTWVNNHAHVLKFSDLVSQRFVEYYLNSIPLTPWVSGMAQPKLNQSKLSSIPIPQPSLSEQKRIVAILDEAFSSIDQAKANTERNLDNARELFDSYLNRVFEERGEGWKEKPLNDVCEVVRGSSPRPIKNYLTENEDGVNWVKISDGTRSGKYILSTRQKITKLGSERSRAVKPGDLLLSNSMSYGQAFIMKTDGFVHDGWFVLREYSDTFELEFFYSLLVSQYVQRQFGVLAAGSVVKNISSDLVKKAILPIPPKTQQLEIMNNVLDLQSNTDEMALNATRKLEAIDSLKQSILKKAFSGELTNKPDNVLNELGV